ncbi:MAG: hypothetical protein QM676_13720 [Novosphingobium sp.]
MTAPIMPAAEIPAAIRHLPIMIPFVLLYAEEKNRGRRPTPSRCPYKCLFQGDPSSSAAFHKLNPAKS